MNISHNEPDAQRSGASGWSVKRAFTRKLRWRCASGSLCHIKYFLLLLLLVFCCRPVSASPDADVRFLRGLIDRELFESVEYFCNEELQSPGMLPEKRFALASELVRSRTRQMILAPPERRAAIRNRIGELEAELTVPDDSNSNLAMAAVSFRFQAAISDASLGDWLRLEADVSPESEFEPRIKQARQVLFDALERFERCDEEIGAVRRRSTGDIDFDKRSLALLWAVRSQWSLAQVSLALSYPPGDDRTFSLNKAVERLTELASLGISDPVVYRARIELARCYRLLGEMEKSREQLVILDGINLKGETLLSAQAELIRYYLAAGAVDEALQYSQTKTNETALCPDYDIARLELLLADHARRKTETPPQEILELVHRIDRQSGPLWGGRARMILSSSHRTDSAKQVTADAGLIRLLGDERFQSGYPAEAVRLYDRAGRVAESSGDSVTAFQCATASAAVLADMSERLAAEDESPVRQRLIETLRDLAKRFPEQRDAPEYHLKAVDLTAGAVRKKQAEPAAYIELLKEHAALWPDSRKVPPALLRAALLAEQQGDMDGALAILAMIPVTSDAGLDAVHAARRCFEALADSANGETDKIVLREAEWFQARLSPAPEKWTEAEIVTALRAAELRLFLDDENHEQAKIAEKLLRDIGLATDASPTVKARSQALLVRALAAQGRKDEAAEALRNLDDDRIRSLAPEERRVFQRTRAGLLAETGKTQEAVDLLFGLLKTQQNDLATWEVLAEILTRQDAPNSLERALQCWSKIVAESDAKSERWWTARERIIEIHEKLGRPDEAKKQFDLLRLLHPDLGGPARKARLERRFGKE